MSERISLYQAKATLSALVRQVREEGRSFTITVHGQPMAELRPLGTQDGLGRTLAERIRALEDMGLLPPAKVSPQELASLPPQPHVPGAFQQWLDERE